MLVLGPLDRESSSVLPLLAGEGADAFDLW